MRFLFAVFWALSVAGCAAPHNKPSPSTTVNAAGSSRPANPADWGPAYRPGMEIGPPAVHLRQAFARAEAFLAKQPFAGEYAKRACGGGGERYVLVYFALLSDSTGRMVGTVRVDTESDACVWLGDMHW